MTPTATASPSKSKATLAQSEESKELAQFRQEWLVELQQRRAGLAVGPTSPTANVLAKPGKSPVVYPLAPLDNVFVSPNDQPRQSQQANASRPYVSAHSHNSIGIGSASTLGSALSVYRRAVEHEQRGELDDALSLYRQAFRMVCEGPQDSLCVTYPDFPGRTNMLTLLTKGKKPLHQLRRHTGVRVPWMKVANTH